jgi:DNA mismatch endonuclease (patch repair protein)
VQFWVNKIEANKARDRKNMRKLNRLGWSVKTIWECQTKNKSKLTDRLLRFLGP